MAKIEDLTVGTIKIVDNAITGSVEDSTTGASDVSVSVANALGFPIIATGAAALSWSHGGGSDTTTFTLKVTRQRDGRLLINRVITRTGAGSGNTQLSDGILDDTATTSETYTLQATASTTAPSGAGSSSVNEKILRALYTKK